MSWSQQPKRTTPPQVILNTNVGFQEYLTAMKTILTKLEKIRQPGDPDPRVMANMMITEVSRFFSEMLPGIDIRETAAFFGSVLGLELGGWVSDGTIGEEQGRNEIVAIVYAACAETIPRVEGLLRKAKESK